jgi:hypothetical protein
MPILPTSWRNARRQGADLRAIQADRFGQADGVDGDAVIVRVGIGIALGDGAAQHFHQFDVAAQQAGGEMHQFAVEMDDDGIEHHRHRQRHDHHQQQRVHHAVADAAQGMIVNLVDPQ